MLKLRSGEGKVSADFESEAGKVGAVEHAAQTPELGLFACALFFAFRGGE